MIEVQSLTRRYGKTIAVDDVSFHIGDNEIVGLLGHNGAGKTTIMRMLSGYLEPSAGSIVIGGVDLATQAQTVQQQLGYLPENLPVYPEMMVADYLDYAATLKGISKKERYQAVRGAILATDLAKRALDPISTLSRGLRQRVGVAQAVLGRPRLLILDEPTNGLDPNQAEHMRQLIKKLARRATVILSTHIMQEVDAICDRVLMLRNGQLALDQRMRDLHRSRTLQLRTNAAVDSLASYLRRMPQVASLKQSTGGDGLMQFSLQLHQNADMDTAANNIAKCVIEAGARLYQLQPMTRDLGNVFREVNAGGD
ncbi:MAG: ABC transporter ATP-binding protein [Gammaproteobacteria bacterium]|nr:MAG: ABC transporter ATP-binding protein [Gammaproteobacteria bacterium]